MKKHLTALILAGLVSTLGACGSQPEIQPTPTATPWSSTTITAAPTPDWPEHLELDPAAVDDSDPDAVAAAYLETANTFDSATDEDPTNAQRRAARWMSPAAREGIDESLTIRPSGTWNEMASHDGYTSATVTPVQLDPPKDSDDTVYRDFTVSVEWHGRDSWDGPTEPEAQIVYLTLQKSTSDKWQVSEIETP